MGSKRSKARMARMRDRLLEGMAERGITGPTAEDIAKKLEAFASFGFPESHSVSFAYLVYSSAWLKLHHPAEFVCALLNSQPMGFYQPSQIVQDVQRHGVRVLPVDVTASHFDSTLEEEPDPRAARPAPCMRDAFRRSVARAPALRLGLREVRGLSRSVAERVVAARADASFRDVADLVRRAGLRATERACLADAGALRSLSGHRHRARWDSTGAELPTPLLADATVHECDVTLRVPTLREEVMADYASQGLSLARHPLALVRAQLARRRISPARILNDPANRGRRLRCAGLVTVRQHPGTAKGVTFVTLEDETGQVNVVVWRKLAERQYRVLGEATVMGVDGVLEANEGVHHLIAHQLHDLSSLLPELQFGSRNFH
jgi:error-prone DNA polymerase